MFEKRALLVDLTVSQWGGRSHDKEVSREIDAGHGSKDAGRFNKCLVAPESLKAVSAAVNALRDYHYAKTLAWNNNGQRLLPAKLLLEYRTDINRLIREFEDEADKFVAKYPSLIHEARTRLNTLFKPDDYPDASKLRRAFKVTLDVFPVPSAGDFRVDVAAQERDELQKEIQQAVDRRQAQATEECMTRIRDVLLRVQKQCVEGKTRITDSLVESIYTIASTMDALNISEDPHITEVVRKVRQEMVVSAETLRNDPHKRKEVGDRASEILETLNWG